MKKLTLAIASLSMYAMSAQAALKTQYFFQADAGKSVATAELGMRTLTLKPNGGGTNTELSGTFLNLGYEYGINDVFAVGIALPYQFAGKAKGTGATNDPKYDGMGDIGLYSKATMDMGGSNLQFGLGLNMSMGKAKMDTTAGNEKYSYQTGRTYIVPYVGYVMPVGNFNLGAKLSFELNLTTAKVDTGTGTDSDYKGGEVSKLGFFGEMPFTGGLVGLELAYRSVNQHKMGTAGTKMDDGYSMVDIHLYGTYEINEMITLIPDINYGMAQVKSSTFDGGSDLSFKLAGRFTF